MKKIEAIIKPFKLDEVKEALWLAPTKGGVFTTEERAYLRSDEVNAARKEIING